MYEFLYDVAAVALGYLLGASRFGQRKMIGKITKVQENFWDENSKIWIAINDIKTHMKINVKGKPGRKPGRTKKTPPTVKPEEPGVIHTDMK